MLNSGTLAAAGAGWVCVCGFVLLVLGWSPKMLYPAAHGVHRWSSSSWPLMSQHLLLSHFWYWCWQTMPLLILAASTSWHSVQSWLPWMFGQPRQPTLARQLKLPATATAWVELSSCLRCPAVMLAGPALLLSERHLWLGFSFHCLCTRLCPKDSSKACSWLGKLALGALTA